MSLWGWEIFSTNVIMISSVNLSGYYDGIVADNHAGLTELFISKLYGGDS